MNNILYQNNLEHLDWLEQQSIYIIREVIAQFSNPALLFSGGKDSAVLLHLAIKAFKIYNKQFNLPFKILHIDTGHNYPEVIEFIQQTITKLNVELIVGYVENSIKNGTVHLRKEQDSRNAAQAITLLETIEEFKFDALMGGARRDEEKSRAKERIFSHRDEFGNWNPKNQRAELWSLYNGYLYKGENMRVFPISNWTELDIWQYIAKEKINLPSIYYAHQRDIVKRKQLIIPITHLTPAKDNEVVSKEWVRFRTVGDILCTCPILSNARSIEDIIKETALSDLTERGQTRMDDLSSETAMEERKKQGYF